MTANSRCLEHNPDHQAVDVYYQDHRAASYHAVVHALAASDAAALAAPADDARAYYEDISSASAIRQGDHWFMGEAYIHGLMRGEVFDEGSGASLKTYMLV
ncbi:hypothetical protein LTR78_009385 [Recurvomyces mirabilis]|uniref:Uncharacterized protein n=1 Tax=Recurvomyces mirabilis TaxID=574656 RepID=A0AAE0TNJ5_9PEZI|nr:hypothetical protein LTR78_009385 [Recurvomyces mirabilis]KAK5154326.1 hypothetical protein LTS14_007011 [Recurvomyces mirabilis]